MKLLAIILSTLVLSTSVFSYGDEFLHAESQADTTSHLIPGTSVHNDHHQDSDAHKEHHEEQDHEQHSDCEDECHFCICACASHNIILSDYELQSLDFDPPTLRTVPDYNFIYSSSYLAAIFQPPRV